ncbi:MAG TPA: NGG1p interacting factor NIF3, partial [Candidatus Moranbacteria bacterium]|nr:NGG1p interacting factor NIF3 [Candidatus Moranbacteria bacterium]
MKLQEIYKLAIDFGIKNDLRGEKEVQKKLARIKNKYEKLNKVEKESFDKERLTNP